MSKLTEALKTPKSISELSTELNIKQKVVPVYLSKLRKTGVKVVRAKEEGVSKYIIA